MWEGWKCPGEGENEEENSWFQLEPAAKRRRPTGSFSNRGPNECPGSCPIHVMYGCNRFIYPELSKVYLDHERSTKHPSMSIDEVSGIQINFSPNA